MTGKHKRKLIISSISFGICISFLCFLFGYQNYCNPKLGDFNILELEEKEEFYLAITPSHNAVSYNVSVKKEQEEIYKTESDNPNISLKDLIVDYGEELTFEVTAKNKNGVTKEAQENYKYLWQKASFKELESRYIDSKNGITLSLEGFQAGEKYIVELEYLNQMIHEETIASDSIYFPYEIVEGYAGRITAKLYTEEKRLLSTTNFYINTPVVGKVKLITPEEGKKDRWNDVNVTFMGGENATNYLIKIFEEGTLSNTITLEKEIKKYTIPAEFLQENKNYYISVEAVYLDYHEITEQDGRNIYIGEKEITSPVFVSHNPTFIKAGTEVKLASRTPNTTIYYTTDGTEPTSESNIYKNPIKIQENMTLKTYAVSNRRYDSEKNTYDFFVQDKQLIVYLSPSNQTWNHGNRESGYTTEMAEMNKLAKIVERILKENGVIVYRNRPTGDINGYLSESNYVKSDLHLAIHSNASKDGTARGIEIYVDKPTSRSLSVATNIYQNLYSIYPGKNIPGTDRGVKYAAGSLGEANDSFIPCGTLIEVAYHDNYEDAKWILENMEQIGNNIASSILSYYN